MPELRGDRADRPLLGVVEPHDLRLGFLGDHRARSRSSSGRPTRNARSTGASSQSACGARTSSPRRKRHATAGATRSRTRRDVIGALSADGDRRVDRWRARRRTLPSPTDASLSARESFPGARGTELVAPRAVGARGASPDTQRRHDEATRAAVPASMRRKIADRGHSGRTHGAGSDTARRSRADTRPRPRRSMRQFLDTELRLW
jgi:hypothetical protein